MTRTNAPASSSPSSSSESKGYSATDVEREVMAVWNKENLFHAEPTDPGKPYAIVIPPPNVTAALHLGHALNNTLQDILIRKHRMMGENTVWMPGTDHAGIATQTVVEKRVLKEEGKKRTDFQRDEFVAKIQAWKDEYEQTITNQLKAMGCSCDWDRQAFTMDEPRAKAVREAFFKLFKDGLIYRGKRLVNWDPVTQTALADDEVENEEVDGFFYYLQYPLEDGSGHVTVATTRPETMLGDTAVAINPKDPRSSGLKGKNVRLPIVGRIIPIVEDDYVVMPDPNGDDPKAKFATGFLKVTPAHDPNDYEIGKRHNLAVINVMAPDASISDKHGWSDVGEAGFLVGQSREAARNEVVEWFRRHGLLEDVKPYRHSVGHSYRSHVPIEPYLSDQWYCRVTDPKLAGAALAAMAPDQKSGTGFQPVLGEAEADTHGQDARATSDKALRFYPARYAKTFQSWHENIRDWCISRQLWWGHRIPVWSLTISSNDASARTRSLYDVSPDGRGRQQWTLRSDLAGALVFHIVSTTRGCIVGRNDKDTYFACIAPGNSPIERELESLGFTQDPDVLDTWFSSGLWPLSTLGWPDESAAALAKWNPTSVLCTAREIITLWVSRMVMFNLYFRNCLPFEDVFIHAMIQDGEGQKMSKTLGNGVDPLDIIHSHGTDAMRFTLASMATNTQDVRMPVDMVDPHSGETFAPAKIADANGYRVAAPIQTSPKFPAKKMVSSYGLSSGQAKPTDEIPLAKNTSSKFDEGKKFCNKIWQVAGNFVIPNLLKTAPEALDESKWSLADKWILSRFNRTLQTAESGIAAYRFDVYAKACYDFFWDDFCNWYVETSKPALRDPNRAGQTAAVLAAVLDGALRLMHPVIPFITEALWWKLNDARKAAPHVHAGLRLVRSSWPTPGKVDDSVEADFARVQAIIVAIRNVKNQYKVEPKKSVTVHLATDAKLPIDVIELLASCKVSTTAPNANAAKATAGGVEILVEGLVDEAADAERNTKRIEELKKEIPALEGRLNNPGYLAKAPPKLVEESKQQLAAKKDELARLLGS